MGMARQAVGFIKNYPDSKIIPPALAACPSRRTSSLLPGRAEELRLARNCVCMHAALRDTAILGAGLLATACDVNEEFDINSVEAMSTEYITLAMSSPFEGATTVRAAALPNTV